ncbi:hypothetical protein AB5N19_10611 [Seiridium cardinale]
MKFATITSSLLLAGLASALPVAPISIGFSHNELSVAVPRAPTNAETDWDYGATEKRANINGGGDHGWDYGNAEKRGDDSDEGDEDWDYGKREAVPADKRADLNDEGNEDWDYGKRSDDEVDSKQAWDYGKRHEA